MQSRALADPEAVKSEPVDAPPSRWPARRAVPARPVTPEPVPHYLRADLMVDGNRVQISLVGVTGGTAGTTAHGWSDAGQPSPAATLPVVLGEWNGRRLCLDLGLCPDALTVTGRLPATERYAMRLLRQMLADGHGAAVLGDDLFGGALPSGCRRVSSLSELGRLDAPGIVVCGRLAGNDLTAARLSRASGGPIPILIGEIPRARWSLRVG